MMISGDLEYLAFSLGVSLGSIEFKPDAFGGVGAFASSNIQRGDVIIDVPYGGCMIANSAQELVIAILNSSSSYIKSLPSTIGATLLTFTLSSSLIGTGLEKWYSMLLDRLRTQYEQLFSSETVTFEHFNWCSAVVSSRSFTLPNHRIGLVPIADILNHSSRPNCEVGRQEDSLVIIANTDIEVGAELTHCYDAGRTNTQWYLCYDFVVKYAEPAEVDVLCDDVSHLAFDAYLNLPIDQPQDTTELRAAKRACVHHLGCENECIIVLLLSLNANASSRWSPLSAKLSISSLGSSNASGIPCHWGLLIVLCRVASVTSIQELPPIVSGYKSALTTSTINNEISALTYMKMMLLNRLSQLPPNTPDAPNDASYVAAGERLVLERLLAFSEIGLAVIEGNSEYMHLRCLQMRSLLWYMGDVRDYLRFELLPLLKRSQGSLHVDSISVCREAVKSEAVSVIPS